MSIKQSSIDRIRHVSFFNKCDDSVFKTAVSGAFLQTFPEGTTLLIDGEPVDFLYFVLEGSVELSAGWKSKDTTLAILRPVSTFILAAVVMESDALMSATTLERSEVLMIPGESLRRAMRENAQFSFAVSEELAACYRGLVRAIKNHKLRDSTERLANYLVTQTARQDNAAQITLPHEKRVLAALLGMTPENLSRAFAKLNKQGVSVSGNIVKFDKMDALKRLARPAPTIDNHYKQSEQLDGKASTERQRGGHGTETDAIY
ncbi:cyclic nucleotide-binding domain-containing protein [Robiginitomaculum antarcticum]|uniref:cyclic nucleotide-binding domain-containing protein n=1 Tax=Robiginitomaculum antarcticum TaxID=437507 RepID=UPI000376F782|nr:cyclic nucleotide-binding domain-containing protein [Robiginitomaculum antarcticum]